MSTHQTYEQHARAIAEEIGKETAIAFCDLCCSADYIRATEEESIVAARIAIKLSANAVRKALLKVGLDSPEAIERYLMDEGLIPNQDKGPLLIFVQPGERGCGGLHNPDNPEPDKYSPAKGLENKPLDNTGKWFNVCCQSCGWTGSSEFLDGGGQIADTGDYGDIYCPNCGQIDPDDYITDQEAGTK